MEPHMKEIALRLLHAYWKQLGVGFVGGIAADEAVRFVLGLFS